MGDKKGGVNSGSSERYYLQKNPLPDRKAKVMHNYVKNYPSVVGKELGL